MRIAKKVVVGTTAQSAQDLLKLGKPDTRGMGELILQAPSGNALDINFGTKDQQPGFIIPGGSATLEISSLLNLHIVAGNGTDEVIILVLR